MLSALRDLLVALGTLFFPVFAHNPAMQSEPIEPPLPSPVPPSPQPSPAPSEGPKPIVGPQSMWWKGVFKVTQAYGCTDFATEGHNPFHPECEYFHEGIDLGMPCGTPIYAKTKLHVLAIDPPGYGPVGNSAAIQLGQDPMDIWLYHMNDYHVKVGAHLQPGDLIGHSGTRGYSTGCHLHFEVRPHGAPYRHSVNPQKWL